MTTSSTPTPPVKPQRIIRRQKFLEDMDRIIPWDDLVGLIEPCYYKGERGRRPWGIETMLRMYLLQVWFNLSDIGTEEALLDSASMAGFAGFELGESKVPDSTTLAKFRNLLERHDLHNEIFNNILNKLNARGLVMEGGTIVDATLIDAPPSTKNAKKERDPDMKQTKKGNQYFLGMKAHIGVCAATGYVHTVKTTPANTSDIAMAAELLRDGDHTLYGDAGYVGVEKRPEV